MHVKKMVTASVLEQAGREAEGVGRETTPFGGGVGGVWGVEFKAMVVVMGSDGKVWK